MWSIFKKEMGSFLFSPISWIVIGIFLTALGLFMWVFPGFSLLDAGYADMGTLFTLTPLVYLFLIPAITMKSFAEEKRGGTLELLFTRPVSEYDIIIGKWLASVALVILSLLPTMVYYWVLYTLGSPKGNLDTPSIIGSYVGLVLVGGVFASVGVLASSLADNQVIGFIIGVFLSFFFYQGFDYIASLPIWGSYSLWVSRLGISANFTSLAKGLIDSRDILYFISVTAIMLQATKLSLQSAR